MPAAPSPICTVNGSATTNGIDVAGGTTITIQLVDLTAMTWQVHCTTTDDQQVASSIDTTLQGSVNYVTKTATLVVPAVACALRFTSTVTDASNNSYSTTFEVHVLTAGGQRLEAFDETVECGSFGHLAKINAAIRGIAGAPIALSPSIAGADDGPAINAAISQYAGKRQIMLAQGAWHFNTPIAIVDGLDLKAAPGSTSVLNIPGATTASSLFVVATPTLTNSTTLSSTPAAGSNQIAIASATGYSIGDYLQIQVTASGIVQLYRIDNISGTTFTLDRDVSIWPFSSGDSVKRATWNGVSKPPTFTIDLGWMDISGTAALVLYAPYARDSKFGRARTKSFLGASADAFCGFHTAAFNCTLEDIYADFFGSVGTTINGFVGAERCTARRVLGTNCTSGPAWKFNDTRYCSAYDCGGTNSQNGASFGTDFGVASNTNVGSRLIGGSWQKNSQYGVVLSACADCVVDVDGCLDNTSYGLFVNGSADTDVRRVIARRNGGNVVVDSTSTGTRIRAAVVESVGTGPNVADMLLQSECTVEGLHNTSKTGTTVYVIASATGAKVIIRGLKKLSQTSGSGNYAFQCTAGELQIEGGDLQLGVNGDVGISTQAAGAVIRLRGVSVSATGGATGTYAVYAHGGTIFVDAQCDFSGVANPFLADSGGIVIMEQRGGFTTSSAGGNAAYTYTYAEYINRNIKDTSATSAGQNRTLPAIAGAWYLYENATTGTPSTLTILPGSVAVTAGKKTLIRCDGTNYAEFTALF